MQHLVALMPLPAAMAFIGHVRAPGTNELLTAWQGVALVGAYAVAALLAGAVSLRRRDA